MPADLDRIVALSRALGDPSGDLAILAEGNTSVRAADGRMLVKASGASLGAVTAEDVVAVDPAALLALVDDPAAGDGEVGAAFAAIEDGCGRRPSVEAMVHAACLDAGAQAVGHTHPVAMLGLLCSPHAEELATRMLFPDQIVVLGPRPLYLPYADPGLELARRVRAALAVHGPARAIYLGNHGFFALGQSTDEVLRITAMAVKAARVLAGALAAGGAVGLGADAVRRIDTRPDEHYRRRALAAEASRG